jgi:molecular chaperone Hsp33
VSDLSRDDRVTPFAVTPLDIRGRLARLGPSIDRILTKHDYPPVVARLVGEAAVLTVLLGSSLKSDARFQLQARTDGALDMLIVDFDDSRNLRAFARFDPERLRQSAGASPPDVLGTGHLALTIDQGPETTQYQGVTPLEGKGLEEAARRYFQQSEQIPTLIRLAVAEEVTGEGRSWRAGGLLVQFLPESGERRPIPDLPPGDAPDSSAPPLETIEEDDAWSEAKALAGTVEDHELVDSRLSSERLLFRLFHERGVTVFDPQPVRDVCRCSSERVTNMLRSFTPQDRADMIGDDGKITVTCEFCSTTRTFDPRTFD